MTMSTLLPNCYEAEIYWLPIVSNVEWFYSSNCGSVHYVITENRAKTSI